MKDNETISMIELLDANNLFNLGHTSIYEVLQIQEKPFDILSRASEMELSKLLYPNKSEYDTTSLGDGIGYHSFLYSEIQKQKKDLVNLCNKLSDESDMLKDNMGIIVYNNFLSEHFDNILESFKSGSSDVFSGEILQFIKQYEIKFNFLGFFIIYTKFINLFNVNNKIIESNEDYIDLETQLRTNYEIIINQYLQFYQVYLLREEVKKNFKESQHYKGIYLETIEELSKFKERYKKEVAKKETLYSVAITPEVLFKLIDFRNTNTVEGAMKLTSDYFTDRHSKNKSLPPVGYEQLKKWIKKNRRFVDKFQNMGVAEIVDNLEREDVISWFKELVRIDSRFLKLLHLL